MMDVLELVELEDDAPMAAGQVLVLEAISRLTMGVPGGWADERAVRSLLRAWGPPRAPLIGNARHEGLIETTRLPTSCFRRLRKTAGETRGAGSAVALLRMTDAGAVSHYAWRADLLSQAGAAA